MTVAVVIGSEGQDGRLLSTRLLGEQTRVVGVGRDVVRVDGRVEPSLRVDIVNPEDASSFLGQFQPNEIYYLAAVHGPSGRTADEKPADLWRRSSDVHVTGLLNCLEWMKHRKPDGRLLYAASAHCFGRSAERSPQSELTPLLPDSIYGISKTAGVQCCRAARGHDATFASVAFLYNHESPLRGPGFVSSRIVSAAVQIAAGRTTPLELQNLAAVADWGYADDYVDAMIRILRHQVPDDFVVATGKARTVKEFVEAAFEEVGLDWRNHVVERPDSARPATRHYVGDASKLRDATGWRPAIDFRQMVSILVRARREGRFA